MVQNDWDPTWELLIGYILSAVQFLWWSMPVQYTGTTFQSDIVAHLVK